MKTSLLIAILFCEPIQCGFRADVTSVYIFFLDQFVCQQTELTSNRLDEGTNLVRKKKMGQAGATVYWSSRVSFTYIEEGEAKGEKLETWHAFVDLNGRQPSSQNDAVKFLVGGLLFSWLIECNDCS